jgi:hypothetical protein
MSDFDEVRDITVIGAGGFELFKSAYSTNTGIPGAVAGQP